MRPMKMYVGNGQYQDVDLVLDERGRPKAITFSRPKFDKQALLADMEERQLMRSYRYKTHSWEKG